MLKRWTGLGLMAAAVLGGCSPGAPDTTAKAGGAAPPAVSGERGEGEGGAGGEGGEGGVAAETAASDPVAYLTALAVTEAHVRAASAALAAGERRAAGEMFAHPVSEVLLAMEPAFKTLGVALFDQSLSDASAAVFDNAAAADIEQRTKSILATLRIAASKAPPSAEAAESVTAKVIADQIDRAASQYGAAKASGAYEPYLDGFGFAATAKAWRDEQGAGLKPATRAAIDEALDALDKAYPTALRPKTLDSDTAALLAASSKVALSL